MTSSGQLSDNLPDYNIARTLGLIPKNDFDFASLANQLDCSRNFYQAGIIYSDGQRRWLVRPSKRIASPNHSEVSHVIVTKVDIQTAYTATRSLTETLNTPSLANEITSTAISCGAAVVTAFLALGAGAAVPLTAGASGIVAAVITAGGVATGLQCFIGAGRLFAIGTGNEEKVAWLDTQEWYTATSTALDIISLAGASAGLKSTLDTYKLMKSTSSAGGLNWLKTLSRPERKRITEEIIRAQNPGISNGGIKAVMKAGVYPTRYPAEALQKSLQRELANVLVNTTAFAGSGLTGTIRNPQNIKHSANYVIGIMQSFSFAESY